MAFRNYSNIATPTTLSGSITDIVTSLTIADGTGYPTSNFTINIDSEVIFVGARSGGSCTSLSRGFNGTTGAAHADAAVVKAVVVADDFTWDARRNLEYGKITVDTPDDDFNSGTLDGKWTVVDGGSGTVTLLATTTTGVYDLTTRPGTMLIQAIQSNELSLRQDYTLPDGKSIIMSCGFTYNHNTNVSNYESQINITLNNNDTTHVSGSYENFSIVIFGGNIYPVVWNGSAGLADVNQQTPIDNSLYFRIARSSLDYSFFWSTGGKLWHPMGTRTAGSAYDNIWIGSTDISSASSTPIATQAINWIRLGDNTYDPW